MKHNIMISLILIFFSMGNALAIGANKFQPDVSNLPSCTGSSFVVGNALKTVLTNEYDVTPEILNKILTHIGAVGYSPTTDTTSFIILTRDLGESSSNLSGKIINIHCQTNQSITTFSFQFPVVANTIKYPNLQLKHGKSRRYFVYQ